MMTLYVASHYKNSPNDLQLMSDAPAHKLFVLLPPMDTAASKASQNGLPEILAVVQVALEGSLSRQVILNSFARGKREAGDLIPWTVSQQFQEDEFASLSGARIVRIAVHPEMQGMGYGTRALQLLERFYRGELVSPNPDDLEDDPEDLQQATTPAVPEQQQQQQQQNTLMDEVIKPRAQLKPLLIKVSDLRPPRLDWIGTSFGLTPPLFKFYRRLQYRPVYLRQTCNDITGEHSAILLKSLVSDASWLPDFNQDFKRRFVALCGFQFKTLPISLCLNILDPTTNANTTDSSDNITTISPYDLKRLESYANNMLDYHMILDLVPTLARAFFLHQLPRDQEENKSMSLSPVQSAILFAVGLQLRPIEDLELELKLPASQVLAMFIKVVRKFAILFRSTRLAQIAANEDFSATKRTFPQDQDQDQDEEIKKFEPCPESLEETLDKAGKDAMNSLKEQQRALIDSLPLDKFAFKTAAHETNDAAWNDELTRKSSKLDHSIISVPRPTTAAETKTSAVKELYEKYVAVDNSIPQNKKNKNKSDINNKSKSKNKSKK
jgi:N-acetyltransferase 10